MDRLACDRMFAAVVETGSFVAAAARLGTSSGQASKLVARLEADLGVRLLDRTTRAVSATEAGRAYFDRLGPILEAFDELDLAVRNVAQTPRGRLRISAPLSFGTRELAPLLMDFARAYPEIALDVDFTDRPVNLVDEGFDLAVRIGRPTDSRLIARRLCDVALAVVAAPAYLEARGVPARPADLAGHDCIIDTNFAEPERWPFAEDGAALRVPVAGRIRLGNAEASLAAAVAGMGLACLPDFIAAPALAEGRVRRVLEPFAPEPMTLSLLYPQNRHLAAKVRVLVDFMVARYRREPSRPGGA